MGAKFKWNCVALRGNFFNPSFPIKGKGWRSIFFALYRFALRGFTAITMLIDAILILYATSNVGR
jgi:hypothetical protein